MKPARGQPLSLCHIDEIADPGSRGFVLPPDPGKPVPEAGERDADLFVVRRGARVFGYLNRCPHTGAPLEWLPHQFLDAENRLIQCSLHGARFFPETGACVDGPCAGEGLRPVALELVDGQIHLAAGQRVPRRD
ncbi:MAG: Rieske 2Fe-2S domain-containing protein [Pseudomonadota bacterium]